MNRIAGLIVLAGFLLLLPFTAQAAARAKAHVECQPTDEAMTFECTIRLTDRKTGEPIDGAKIVVYADMPAMAMVHNVKPAEAVPTGMAGMYRMRIHVEMMGDWALRLKISGPLRDQVVVKQTFGASTMGGMNPRSKNMKDRGAGAGMHRTKDAMKGHGGKMK